MFFSDTFLKTEFDAVVRSHIALFRKFALRILKNRDDADDAVQNALLKGWKRRFFLRTSDRLLQWLCSIVVNESYNILRRRQAERTVVSQQIEQVQMSKAYAEDEQFRRLDDAIANLPEIYRTTVHVAILSGIGAEEASKLLGCSVNALYQRTYKARQLLLEALKNE